MRSFHHGVRVFSGCFGYFVLLGGVVVGDPGTPKGVRWGGSSCFLRAPLASMEGASFSSAAREVRTTALWYARRTRMRRAIERAAEGADHEDARGRAGAGSRPWTEEEAALRCALEEAIYRAGHEHGSTLDALTALVEWLTDNGHAKEAVDAARTVALRL